MRGSAFKDRVEAGRLLGEELVAYARGKKMSSCSDCRAADCRWRVRWLKKLVRRWM